jgi:hypothetical protein
MNGVIFEGDILLIGVVNYTVRTIEVTDDPRAAQPISVALQHDNHGPSISSRESMRALAHLRFTLDTLFSAAGWDGEGDISCIMIPSCYVADGTGDCTPVFYVEQGHRREALLAEPADFELQF